MLINQNDGSWVVIFELCWYELY